MMNSKMESSVTILERSASVKHAYRKRCGGAYFMLFLPIITVVAIIALPVLVAAFILTRLVQFIYGCGYVYDRGTKLKLVIKVKLFIRTWILLNAVYLMFCLGTLYAVGCLVPRLGLRHSKVLGYPIMHWIENYIIIFVLFFISYVMSIVCIKLVVHFMPLKYHSFRSGSYVVSDTVHEIIDCFVFLLFAEQMVVAKAHFLKHYKILGFYAVHRLFHVVVLLLVCHDLIGLSTHIFVWGLHKLVAHPGSNPKSTRNTIITKILHRKSLVYWANGLKPSIMFAFTSLMLLFVWVFHFGELLKAQEHKTIYSKKVLRVGTWSTLCLFIFSIFWFIKTYILLVLENRIVYRKFGSIIPNRGKQLYFLGVIGRLKYDFFKLRYEEKSSERTSNSNYASNKCNDFRSAVKTSYSWMKSVGRHCYSFVRRPGKISRLLIMSIYPIIMIEKAAYYQFPATDPKDDEFGAKQQEDYMKKLLSVKRRKRVKKDLLNGSRKQNGEETSTLYDLQIKIQYFLDARQTLLHDNYSSEILQNITGVDMMVHLKKLIMHNECDEAGDWDTFRELVLEYSSKSKADIPEMISDKALRTWVERAHNRCVLMANTLRSAKKIVDCLDRIMSVILFVAAFLLWLLLTGLTTKDLIVLVGSPLLALNFMFGDTSSAFFHGIVFVYTMHPFDVGDLCVIDEKLLEVINIDVWNTTFLKVETQETMIHPNLELMKKTIINHKNKFDWSDYVEIYVNSPDNEKINTLKKKIEAELKDGQKYETEAGYNRVKVMTTEENKIKIGVNFKYNAHEPEVDEDGMYNYFECFKKKQKLQSEFIQKIVVDDKKIQDVEIQVEQ